MTSHAAFSVCSLFQLFVPVSMPKSINFMRSWADRKTLTASSEFIKRQLKSSHWGKPFFNKILLLILFYSVNNLSIHEINFALTYGSALTFNSLKTLGTMVLMFSYILYILRRPVQRMFVNIVVQDVKVYGMTKSTW